MRSYSGGTVKGYRRRREQGEANGRYEVNAKYGVAKLWKGRRGKAGTGTYELMMSLNH